MATAEGLRKIAEAINQPGGSEAVSLRVAEQYVDAFSGVAKAGTTLILPGDLSNMGSMVAAAMQVVKQGK